MFLITFLITLLYPIQTLAQYGAFAGIGDFPFEVAITYKDKYVCGGVVVGETHVITAAHCIKLEDLKGLRVVAGEVKQANFRDEHKNVVKKIKLHPRYRESTREFDIALLTMERRIVSAQNIAPIHMVSSEYVVEGSTTVKLVAWDHLHDIQLANAETTLWDPAKCTALNIYGPYDFNYPSLPLTSENTLCANIPTDSCIHDDAGALLVDEKLLGILSWNINCNQSDKPLVFSNMAIFSEWVTRVTTETK